MGKIETATLEASLFAARIFSDDISATALFYTESFGMIEFTRVSLPGIEEIIMKAEAHGAAVPPSAFLVIMQGAFKASATSTPTVIFHVADVDSAFEACMKAGGISIRGPETLGNVRFAYVKDPAGNSIELLKLLAQG